MDILWYDKLYDEKFFEDSKIDKQINIEHTSQVKFST